MTKQEVRVECLSELFNDLNIQATPEQLQSIAKDFAFHIEMEREMESYQHAGFKEECQKCKRLETQLSEVKNERDAYQASVKQRRRASAVWVQDGNVYYEK